MEATNFWKNLLSSIMNKHQIVAKNGGQIVAKTDDNKNW